MRPTSRFVLLGCLVVLTACSSETRSVYHLSFNISDEGKQQELALAGVRVAERRLQAMGEQLMDKEVTNNSDGINVALTVSNKEVAEALQERLTEHFTMAIMRQAEADKAEVTVEGHGGFASTGITQNDLASAQSGVDSEGKGMIVLSFTEGGRRKMSDLFKKEKGNVIGLFVRGKLASKLLVETETLRDTIVIRDLPSTEIADIFADDLNVGLHVTFVPVP